MTVLDFYILDYIAAIISLAGTIFLLTKKYKMAGWSIWIVASALWCLVGFQNGLFGMILLNFITMVFEIYGTIKEYKKIKNNKIKLKIKYRKGRKKKLKLEDLIRLKEQ